MAQMREQREYNEGGQEREESQSESRRSSGSFKFNVAAPEFVPTLAQAVAPVPAPAAAQVPITGYFYPCFQSMDGATGSWIYVADQEITIPLVQPKATAKVGSTHIAPHQPQQQPKEVALSEELKLKIIKQV